jgi:glycosyltransferase involved in cell wall biosynthesis
VLHLGRINFKKGLDILVDSFSRIAKSRPDVHLVIAGPDEDGYGAKVRRWLQEKGVAGRATFTGMLAGDLLLAALRDASVFALPSYSENFGIAVIEAMACGVPVVISNKINICREVRESGAGLVTPCDAVAFADALGTVLADVSLRTSMGQKGRQLVREHFSWLNVASKLEAAYEAIITSTKSSRHVNCENGRSART